MNESLCCLEMKPMSISCQLQSGVEEKNQFFMKSSMEVVRKQLSLARKEHILMTPIYSDLEFEPASRKLVQTAEHPMCTKYSWNIYQSVKSEVLRSLREDVFGNKTLKESNPFFVALVQVYSDKPATTLKANATVAYPVNTVLLNFSKEFRRYLIDHGHTLVELLPVSTSEISKD